MITTMNLQLSLIKRWFRCTELSGKSEDYREITPYWCNRFLLFKGEVKNKEFWGYEFFTIINSDPTYLINKYIDRGIVAFKKFETNTMTLGYPKSTDTDRILKFKHAGIEIREGNPNWGAEQGKLYFVIKHGEKIR